MVAAGVMTGLLPLVHTHTFLVVIAVATCMAILFQRWLFWGAFFAIALGLAAPELVWAYR